MAKRGRPTKPTTLKVFEGNPGKRPLPENEPVPMPGPVVPPLPLDDVGQAVWDSVLKTSPPNLITPHDAHALYQYCTAWSDYVIAAKEVEKLEGNFFVFSQKGGVYQHPAIGMRNQAFARIRQIGPLFGWSPSDRAGMDFSSGKQSPAEQLMAILKKGANGSA